MLMLAITPARMKSAPAAVTIQPARLRPFQNKIPTPGPTAAEELPQIVMRRYERASTLLTSNRPVEDWENCSATAPQSLLCSTAYSITAISSNAGHGVGEPKSTSRNNGRFQRCSTSLAVLWAA